MGFSKCKHTKKTLTMNVNNFHLKLWSDKNEKWKEAQKIQQDPVILTIQPPIFRVQRRTKDQKVSLHTQSLAVTAVSTSDSQEEYETLIKFMKPYKRQIQITF